MSVRPQPFEHFDVLMPDGSTCSATCFKETTAKYPRNLADEKDWAFKGDGELTYYMLNPADNEPLELNPVPNETDVFIIEESGKSVTRIR